MNPDPWPWGQSRSPPARMPSTVAPAEQDFYAIGILLAAMIRHIATRRGRAARSGAAANCGEHSLRWTFGGSRRAVATRLCRMRPGGASGPVSGIVDVP